MADEEDDETSCSDGSSIESEKWFRDNQRHDDYKFFKPESGHWGKANVMGETLVQKIVKQKGPTHTSSTISLIGYPDKLTEWDDADQFFGERPSGMRVRMLQGPKRIITGENLNRWDNVLEFNKPPHRRKAAWVDYLGKKMGHEPIDAKTLKEAVEIIINVIKEEAAIVGNENVFVFSFSLGGCVSIHAVAELPQDFIDNGKLGGLHACVSYVTSHTEEVVETLENKANIIILRNAMEDDNMKKKMVVKSQKRLANTGVMLLLDVHDPDWEIVEHGSYWQAFHGWFHDFLCLVKDPDFDKEYSMPADQIWALAHAAWNAGRAFGRMEAQERVRDLDDDDEEDLGIKDHPPAIIAEDPDLGELQVPHDAKTDVVSFFKLNMELVVQAAQDPGQPVAEAFINQHSALDHDDPNLQKFRQGKVDDWSIKVEDERVKWKGIEIDDWASIPMLARACDNTFGTSWRNLIGKKGTVYDTWYKARDKSFF
jgi:hypothetical protein